MTLTTHIVPGHIAGLAAGLIKPSHILVVIIVVIVLFGASKLPDVARNVGKSAKILKREMRELTEDDAPTTNGTTDVARTGAPNRTGADREVAHDADATGHTQVAALHVENTDTAASR